MCTVLLPPGDNPIAVNKYIINVERRKWIMWWKKLKTTGEKCEEED